MIFPFVSTHLKLTVDAIWNLLLIDALKLLQNCNSLINFTFGDQPPETTSFRNQETTVSKSRLGEPVDCVSIILLLKKYWTNLYAFFLVMIRFVLKIVIEVDPNKRFLLISPNP